MGAGNWAWYSSCRYEPWLHFRTSLATQHQYQHGSSLQIYRWEKYGDYERQCQLCRCKNTQRKWEQTYFLPTIFIRSEMWPKPISMLQILKPNILHGASVISCVLIIIIVIWFLYWRVLCQLTCKVHCIYNRYMLVSHPTYMRKKAVPLCIWNDSFRWNIWETK